MENKYYSLEIITNKEETDIYGFVLDGKEYLRNAGETVKHFMERVEVSANISQGIDFWKNFNREENKMITKRYEEAKKVLKKEPSKITLKQRIVATAAAAVLAISGIAYGLTKANTKEVKGNAYATEQVIDKENQELKAIYEELSQMENGAAWVERLQAVDSYQQEFNDKMKAFPDGDGDTLFLKAEEAAAIDAIANGTNINVPSLLPGEKLLCTYLIACGYTSEGVLASGQANTIDQLIIDENVKKQYKDIETATQNVLDGKNIENKVEIITASKAYPEIASLAAYVGEETAMAIEEKITGDELEDYQNEAKGNAILNKTIVEATAKANYESQIKKKFKLSAQAFEAMDKQNINVALNSRNKFDLSTTERMAKEIESIKVSVSGGVKTCTITTKDHKTYKVSEEKAKSMFGEKAVEKAKEDADKKAGIDDLNKKADEDNKKVDEDANLFTQGMNDGKADGLANRPSNPKSSDSFYLNGYNKGYANGQKQYNAMQEDGEIIEQKEERHTEAETAKAVVQVQRNEEVVQNTNTEEDIAVRSRVQ